MFAGGEFGGVKAESSWGFGVTDLPWVVDWGFFGRNPCWLARHRDGATRGWHRSFLEGIMATLHPLPFVYQGEP
jgi:hypothetical protein